MTMKMTNTMTMKMATGGKEERKKKKGESVLLSFLFLSIMLLTDSLLIHL